MKKKVKQIIKDNYVILFPKLHYSQAKCLTLMTNSARPQFMDVLHHVKNYCGIGFNDTVYIFNVEVFFAHRNAGILKQLDEFWLYYLEVDRTIFISKLTHFSPQN